MTDWESAAFFEWLAAHDAQAHDREMVREMERAGYSQTAIQARQIRAAFAPGLTRQGEL